MDNNNIHGRDTACCRIFPSLNLCLYSGTFRCICSALTGVQDVLSLTPPNRDTAHPSRRTVRCPVSDQRAVRSCNLRMVGKRLALTANIGRIFYMELTNGENDGNRNESYRNCERHIPVSPWAGLAGYRNAFLR